MGPAAGQGVMSRNKNNHRFAPVPLRALRDQRLAARHLRILGIVAAHDQLGGNGAGCYATQRRLAKLASCGESRLSDALSDLRHLGYIKSERQPQKSRLRVHRVIYNEQDARWDRGTFRKGKVTQAHTFPNGKVELSQSGKNTTVSAQEKCPKDADFSQDSSRGTYVLTYKKDKKDNRTDTDDRTDCAEARSRSAVTEAKKHLTEFEDLAASSDRDNLKFERARLQQIADDACLPEDLNERAVRLLSQIPSDQ
jgi:hypothetical protein